MNFEFETYSDAGMEVNLHPWLKNDVEISSKKNVVLKNRSSFKLYTSDISLYQSLPSI